MGRKSGHVLQRNLTEGEKRVRSIPPERTLRGRKPGWKTDISRAKSLRHQREGFTGKKGRGENRYASEREKRPLCRSLQYERRLSVCLEGKGKKEIAVMSLTEEGKRKKGFSKRGEASKPSSEEKSTS